MVAAAAGPPEAAAAAAVAALAPACPAGAVAPLVLPVTGAADDSVAADVCESVAAPVSPASAVPVSCAVVLAGSDDAVGADAASDVASDVGDADGVVDVVVSVAGAPEPVSGEEDDVKGEAWLSAANRASSALAASSMRLASCSRRAWSAVTCGLPDSLAESPDAAVSPELAGSPACPVDIELVSVDDDALPSVVATDAALSGPAADSVTAGSVAGAAGVESDVAAPLPAPWSAAEVAADGVAEVEEICSAESDGAAVSGVAAVEEICAAASEVAALSGLPVSFEAALSAAALEPAVADSDSGVVAFSAVVAVDVCVSVEDSPD